MESPRIDVYYGMHLLVIFQRHMATTTHPTQLRSLCNRLRHLNVDDRDRSLTLSDQAPDSAAIAEAKPSISSSRISSLLSPIFNLGTQLDNSMPRPRTTADINIAQPDPSVELERRDDDDSPLLGDLTGPMFPAARLLYDCIPPEFLDRTVESGEDESDDPLQGQEETLSDNEGALGRARAVRRKEVSALVERIHRHIAAHGHVSMATAGVTSPRLSLQRGYFNDIAARVWPSWAVDEQEWRPP